MAHIPNPIPLKDKTALVRVAEISGENVSQCMQCGTCSAVCPMVEFMGLTVRQGMHLLQFGRTEEVIKAKIGETCASCQNCMVRCPRGIDVARVYDAVRQLTLRENVDFIKPEAIPAEVMAEAPTIAFVAGFRKLTA